MLVQIMSDLHLEFEKQNPTFIPKNIGADILILAGDINVGLNSFDWIRARLEDYNYVIYVIGNHEYYHNLYDELSEGWQKFADKINLSAKELGYKGHLYLLDDHKVVINGVDFIGATLWTDFRKGNYQIMYDVGRLMNDFRIIRKLYTSSKTGNLKRKRFFPADAYKIHNISKAFIEKQLSEGNNKKVVITHHSPSYSSTPPIYKNNLATPGYSSDLPELLEKADLYVHGHTHNSFDYVEQNCRIICNPRGYYKYDENPEFNPGLTVEV